MSPLKRLFFFCIFLATGTSLRAQTADTAAATNDLIELLNAAELEGGVRTVRGQQVQFRKLRGDVRFRHNEATMYCDSAYQYLSSNAIEAFGRVRLNQGDTITLTGDSLYYSGVTQLARVRGRSVVLRDQQMTLTTQHLDFDRANHLAYYFLGGTIVDETNTLTSQQGYYDTETEYMRFKDSVTLRSFDPAFTLTSDTLEYSRVTKVAYFRSLTHVVSEGKTLTARRGEYNTLTRVSDFRQGAEVETADYTLSGDTLFYDEMRRLGRARQNVVIVAKSDSVRIEGDRGYYDGALGFAQVQGRALMKKPVSGGDTIYIASDTLVSLTPTDTLAHRLLLAYGDVRILRDNVQGICDSLVYDLTDSLIHLYHDPVLWSGESQLTADTIRIQLANDQIDRLYMRTRAFIISSDTLRNYNQIKGRNMASFFRNNDMHRVSVDGNAESIYFLLDDDTKLMGMNKTVSSNLEIYLVDNEVEEIEMLQNQEGQLVPPHELADPDRRLRDFKWRILERPLRKDVVERRRLDPETEPDVPPAPAGKVITKKSNASIAK